MNRKHKLVETMEHAREETVQSLESAASTVRSTAAHGIHALDNLAEGTAGRLDSTAMYVRQYHPVSDMQNAMQRNPGLTLCLGIAAGFFAGISLRRAR